MSLPHARGGVSRGEVIAFSSAGSSPRSWGCFQQHALSRLYPTVFPTLVGVFPIHRRPYQPDQRLPHARGGVSPFSCPAHLSIVSSPRSWGCFSRTERQRPGGAVFPTLVGVFPRLRLFNRHLLSLPHARGGVSILLHGYASKSESSPRSWGCFQSRVLPPRRGEVFPTLVGVFLSLTSVDTAEECLPHARGGVSKAEFYRRASEKVFPTLVGVFPQPMR